MIAQMIENELKFAALRQADYVARCEYERSLALSRPGDGEGTPSGGSFFRQLTSLWRGNHRVGPAASCAARV